MLKLTYTQTPEAQIERLFAPQPTVFEIFITEHQVSDNRGIAVEFVELAKLTYKHTPEVQIELLFALRPTVVEIFTTKHQVSDNRGICSLIRRISQIDI